MFFTRDCWPAGFATSRLRSKFSIATRSTDWRAVSALRQLLRQRQINVLHVHGYKATIVGGLAARGLGLKVVKTVHGRLEPLAAWKALLSQSRLWLNTLLDRLASRLLVDAFVFVSEDIRGATPGTVRGTPHRLIYNGLQAPSLAADGPGRDDPGDGTFNVGIVGRIAKVKGHTALLQAFGHLRHLENLRLHVFGTGPMEDECKRFCEKAGLSRAVRFHGFQHPIHHHIRALDVLVMPSLHEGLPYVLLEAMYLNVPVIASRVGGLREVLEKDDAGLVVPANDPVTLAAAIERLYHNPLLRTQLARRAYEKVRREFLAPRMVREYHALYAELLAS